MWGFPYLKQILNDSVCVARSLMFWRGERTLVQMDALSANEECWGMMPIASGCPRDILTDDS